MRSSIIRLLCGVLPLCCAFSGMAAETLEARLVPNPVAAGETFSLELSTTDGRAPRLLQMPPFEPRGQSRSTRSDNTGTRTGVSYHFVAGEPGNFTIPPLPVKLGGETVHTPELTLKVLKSEALEVTGAEAIFWRAEFAGPERKTAYVGEEIPLEFRFYMPPDNTFRLQLNYPEVAAGKSVFRDFRAENPGAVCRYFTTKARLCYTESEYPENCYLFFGKETKGLPEDLLIENEKDCVRIPMFGEIRSLNLANSVAVAVYEALRRQGFGELNRAGRFPAKEIR